MHGLRSHHEMCSHLPCIVTELGELTFECLCLAICIFLIPPTAPAMKFVTLIKMAVRRNRKVEPSRSLAIYSVQLLQSVSIWKRLRFQMETDFFMHGLQFLYEMCSYLPCIVTKLERVDPLSESLSTYQLHFRNSPSTRNRICNADQGAVRV